MVFFFLLFFFKWDKVMELVGGGSVINGLPRLVFATRPIQSISRHVSLSVSVYITPRKQRFLMV